MTTSAALPRVDRTDRADELVAELRRAVGRGLPPDLTAHLAAECLLPHLGAPDLLTGAQQTGDPASYRQHLLHAEPDGSFSLVALVWLPGQRTSVHDHLSWCATGVHLGEETERRYRLVPDGPTARLVATGDVVNPSGTVCGFAPPGDIHRVRNSGTGTAVSLHVYGADLARLGSSIRRVYQLPTEG
ncbi:MULTISPECIES: cysteine dioxygenase family protein [unclassified Kitasatospora]|uniref:cysteine dioxygenase family protein n=1 Tax=unclassified Kitasatospora TaxID=2633591 RepID=UPI000708DC6D|nr:MULTISPECIES: cysteine dioxygenase family protein [unclassified Kitasatospora]KQV13341.1 cysteine dioxygenase [Kitasatospora sp. Root107]KRB75211.1 cysteine dioxygenase [Kitasatospora sp. Root187]